MNSKSETGRRAYPFRFNSGQRLGFILTFGILLLSGVTWTIFHQFFQIEGEFGPEIHPGERWSLIVHGASAFLSLVMLGSIFVFHVQRAWKGKQNRRSGAIFASILLILTATGFLFYYGGGEMDRAVVRWIHLVSGFALPILLFVHIVVGRRSRRKVAAVDWEVQPVHRLEVREAIESFTSSGHERTTKF